jgi:hypothetical protein
MNTDQNQYAQEDEMANGPVSAGASNKDAQKFNQNNQQLTSDKRNDSGNYNKMDQNEASGPMQGTGMANDQIIASPGGGTLPSNNSSGGSDSSRGGINTSNSTVSGGSSSAGAVAGAGEHRDRGSMTDVEANATSNTADTMNENSGS